MDGCRYRCSGPVELYLGDARDVLHAMPDASVDCLVTSPPFWSLRDYGTGTWTGGDPCCTHQPATRRRMDGDRCPACAARWTDPQYGLEPTVDAYVDRLVAVFDQARRVLTRSGTCWLNLGDSCAGGSRRAHDTTSGITASRRLSPVRSGSPLPAKNLVGVPWRVAFALQTSGCILRNAVIWAKPNPMPESVRDRLSTGYELLFLLTRSARYHFDLDPIRIPVLHPDAADGTRVFGGARNGATGGIGATARRRGGTYGRKHNGKHNGDASVEPRAASGNLRPVGHAHTAAHPKGRNPGDVWTVATRPYRGAHVAPFPVDLPLRAIAAGCPAGGIVCDPFSGAATTGLAALRLGRRYIGIDVNPAFHGEALHRLRPYLPDPVDGPVDGPTDGPTDGAG
ncbi:methyltransferase [Virgisporangium aurantiacum]|uniref:Methyltransferase n=1 Tax=Virgisporangium aurantiacum TaxID=175570 RepID=A0A8J3ZIL8_9ACTN|nr:methyltransferase [Virgisporangium aurantiacum]